MHNLTADGATFLSGIAERNQEFVRQLHGSDDISSMKLKNQQEDS